MRDPAGRGADGAARIVAAAMVRQFRRGCARRSRSKRAGTGSFAIAP